MLVRGAGDEAFVFVLNFSNQTKTVQLGSRTLTNVETGAAVRGRLKLAPLAADVYHIVDRPAPAAPARRTKRPNLKKRRRR